MADINVQISGEAAPNELIQAIRSAFVAQGKSLSGWCKENTQPSGRKIYEQNVAQAFKGGWEGEAATALCLRVIKESGLEVIES